MFAALLLLTLTPVVKAIAAGGITVDSVEATPGSKVAVPIRLIGNIVPIAGIQVALRIESSFFTIDSVSLEGSIKPVGMMSAIAIDNATDSVGIILYPDNSSYPYSTISAASGLLATLHGTVSGDAPLQDIGVDSIFHGTSSIMWTGAGFSDDQGLFYEASVFHAGAVMVQTSTAIDEGMDGNQLPNDFSLSQNYPNPFNPTTTISFTLPVGSSVRLDVFNVLGQKVVTLLEERLSAGSHQVSFDASEQPSGIYFYRLTSSQGKLTKKMVLLK